MSFVEPETKTFGEAAKQSTWVEWTLGLFAMACGILLILNVFEVIHLGKWLTLLAPIAILSVAIRKWRQGRVNG